MCQKYILSVYKSNIEFKGGAHAQDRQIRKSAKYMYMGHRKTHSTWDTEKKDSQMK